MKNYKMILTVLAILLLPTLSFGEGLLGYFPFQYQFQCDEGLRTEQLLLAANRLELGENVFTYLDAQQSDDPACRWETMAQEISLVDNIFMDSHGFMQENGQSGLVVESYLSTTAAEDAFLSYSFNYGSANFILSGTNILMTYSGIQTLLTPGKAPETNALIYACFSSFCESAWGAYVPYDGGIYFGYPIAIDNQIACSDYDIMVSVLACSDFEFSGLENDFLTAYNQTSMQGILSGNADNSLNPQISCKALSAVFEKIGFHKDRLHWISSNEEEHSQYLVEGVNYLGDNAQRVAVVDGKGTDGLGVMRSYAVSSQGFRFLRITEFDNGLAPTTSEWIASTETYSQWPLAPGQELDLRAIQDPGSAKSYTVGTITGGPVLAEHTIEPTDVLVFTSLGHEAEASRIRGVWQMTTDNHGNYFRAQAWSGSTDPTDVKQLYRDVVLANAEFNASNPERPYRIFPVLQIVGNGRLHSDGTQVGPVSFRYPDTVGGSADAGWSSYSLMTDIDDDMVPDGPVIVVPLVSYADAQIHAEASRQFNNSFMVYRGAALFLGDSHGQVSSSWLEERMFEEFPSYVAGRNQFLTGTLLSSEYLEAGDEAAAQMRSDGADLMNQGVSEVWYCGLNTSPGKHTPFLSHPEDFDLAQRYLVFGPTCQFGQTQYSLSGYKLEEMMFNKPEGAVAVGGIGNLNASYYHQHRKLALLMQEVMGTTVEGTLLCDVALTITQLFLERYPEHKDYGLGIQAMGSVAKLLTPAETSDAGDMLVYAGADFQLTAGAGTNGSQLSFNIPRESIVSLSIYDIRGSLVKELVKGQQMFGANSINWQDQRISSGLYFARLQVDGATATTKITIVR